MKGGEFSSFYSLSSLSKKSVLFFETKRAFDVNDDASPKPFIIVARFVFFFAGAFLSKRKARLVAETHNGTNLLLLQCGKQKKDHHLFSSSSSSLFFSSS